MSDSPFHAPVAGGAPVAAGADRHVPQVASARRYLRDALPTIYRADNSCFAMRFLYALERVLDPRVAIIDSLAAYLTPQLAPEGMVDAMADWLGLELDDAPAGIPRPRLLDRAEEIARKRGTRAGLELALRAAFPDLRLQVQDAGTVLVCDGDATPTMERFPGFVVRCLSPLSSSQRGAIEWVIERELPLHVRHRLVPADEPREAAR
jgi:phage tail-like protein